MKEVDHLTPAEVMEIHAMQITRFGGAAGVRDMGLLESALAQAQATFGGQPVYADLFEMAAAYLFHLVSNHAFVDGNKRIGLAAALVFLDLNGHPIRTGTQVLYELTMQVACGEVTRKEVAQALRHLATTSASVPGA